MPQRGIRLDPKLMRSARDVWSEVSRELSQDVPGLMRRFVGKDPGRRLAAHPDEPLHQAVIYSLAGQVPAVVKIFQGFSLYVSAGYPGSTRYMYEGAQVFRWCAARLGLLGWAEVWDVPVPGPKRIDQPFRLGARGMEDFLEPETHQSYIREFGTLDVKSGRRSSPGGDVSGLNQIVEALERSVIGLRDPETNDVGLSEERLLELVDFFARQVRLWMGLPLEQPVPEPDFSVELPEEFRGFGPELDE